MAKIDIDKNTGGIHNPSVCDIQLSLPRDVTNSFTGPTQSTKEGETTANILSIGKELNDVLIEWF